MAQFVHLNTKNAALKGPKRFLADLEDMSGASAAGLTVNTLQAVGAFACMSLLQSALAYISLRSSQWRR
jgi:hypothetical protein